MEVSVVSIMSAIVQHINFTILLARGVLGWSNIFIKMFFKVCYFPSVGGVVGCLSTISETTPAPTILPASTISNNIP